LPSKLLVLFVAGTGQRRDGGACDDLQGYGLSEDRPVCAETIGQ
jgi:hypothetical protein